MTWPSACWRRCGSTIFRKLDALAPAYLVRRRTGDLMALATHDIEMVEYFFAHTVAPAFVAMLVPAVVLVVLGSGQPLDRARAAALPRRRRPQPLPDARAASTGWARRRARRRASSAPSRSIRCRGWRDRRLPAGAGARGSGSMPSPIAMIALRLPFFGELTCSRACSRSSPASAASPWWWPAPRWRRAARSIPRVLPLLTLLAMAAFLPVSEIAQVGRQLADTLGATRRIYAPRQ